MSHYLINSKDLETLTKFIHANTITGLGVPLLNQLNTMKFKGKMSKSQEESILEIFNRKKTDENNKE